MKNGFVELCQDELYVIEGGGRAWDTFKRWGKSAAYYFDKEFGICRYVKSKYNAIKDAFKAPTGPYVDCTDRSGWGPTHP